MRYKVGAEQLTQIRSLAQRHDGIFRSARAVPVGPTHAVDAASGAVACGIKVHGLEVLDQDWEQACFVEKCPGCFAAVLAHGKNHVARIDAAGSSPGAEGIVDGET
jgi:hypothetical protein